MLLRKLMEQTPYYVAHQGDIEMDIRSLSASSRQQADGGLFFCVPGARFDAHDFAEEAVKNGCTALVVDHFLPLHVPQVKVSNVRAAMARMAAAFYGHPANSMRLVGVTGTKGKTTTSYMIKAIFEQAGFLCGLIGTTGNMIGQQRIPSNYTTPDPIELHRDLRKMADAGVQVVIMEVSAHAIDMHRLDGLVFDVGSYTNFSQDHLDYFHTMQAYFETKKRFFTSGMVRNATFNADEETSAQVLKDITIPAMTYGIAANADLYARDIEITEEGVSFEMQLHRTCQMSLKLHMTGMFNVYNALSAASCALTLGIPMQDVVAGLEKITSVPGRIEMLPTQTPYKVILDYSHSPDALTNILNTVREFAQGRIIALFGCGGDRDKGKRPIMGEIGGQLADLCVLTSDNPRSEDPLEILAAIESGIRPTGKPYVVIEDRREAIRHAMTIAREGDIVVLCGKGHETYQEIKGVKHPFDEKVVVQELLMEMQDGESSPM